KRDLQHSVARPPLRFATHHLERWFGKLPDQDSNLEQTGYIAPQVSLGNGLSHHPGGVWGARGWLIGRAPHQLVSAPSRLRLALRRAWLRIAATRSAAGFLNSPHFSAGHC